MANIKSFLSCPFFVCLYILSLFILHILFFYINTIMEKVNCNYCWWEVQKGVIKCLHCGEFLNKKYRNSKTMIYRGFFQSTPKIFCPECEYEWRATYKSNMNVFIFILLLALWIIPWLIYYFWTWKLYFLCPKCKNKFINKV